MEQLTLYSHTTSVMANLLGSECQKFGKHLTWFCWHVTPTSPPPKEKQFSITSCTYLTLNTGTHWQPSSHHCHSKTPLGISHCYCSPALFKICPALFTLRWHSLSVNRPLPLSRSCSRLHEGFVPVLASVNALPWTLQPPKPVQEEDVLSSIVVVGYWWMHATLNIMVCHLWYMCHRFAITVLR